MDHQTKNNTRSMFQGLGNKILTQTKSLIGIYHRNKIMTDKWLESKPGDQEDQSLNVILRVAKIIHVSWENPWINSLIRTKAVTMFKIETMFHQPEHLKIPSLTVEKEQLQEARSIMVIYNLIALIKIKKSSSKINLLPSCKTIHLC